MKPATPYPICSYVPCIILPGIPTLTPTQIQSYGSVGFSLRSHIWTFSRMSLSSSNSKEQGGLRLPIIQPTQAELCSLGEEGLQEDAKVPFHWSTAGSACFNHWPCPATLSSVTINNDPQWPLNGLGHTPLA